MSTGYLRLFGILTGTAILAVLIFAAESEYGAFLLYLHLVYLVVAVALSFPIIYSGRKRAQWKIWEGIAFLLSLWVWLTRFSTDPRQKTLANLGEWVYFTPRLHRRISAEENAGQRPALQFFHSG